MKRKMNPNVVKTVNILKDGNYHDGTTIGQHLNMTRSAVWKVIKKLASYELRIASIKGRGYALLEPLALLERNKIRSHLQDNQLDIEVFETISSTSDYLKTIKNSQQHTKVCLAEHMSQGRGRWNREWYAPFGKNLYLSCLYSFRKDISELAGLSLAVSLAIIKTLKQYKLDNKLCVKWPNDVMYDQKKLSGTLIEIQAESHGLSHVIIGIGLNVNMLTAKNISQSWTSLQKILGICIDRNELCAHLLNNLLAYLNEFAKHGFAYFADEWAAEDGLFNQTVTLINVNAKIQGKVTGVNEQGHLLLQLKNGTVRAFSSGDASITKKSIRTTGTT